MVVGAILGIAVIVFGVLWLTRERLDYAGAKGNVKELLSVKDAVLEEWGDGTVVESYEELKENSSEDFANAVEKFEEYYGSLGASNVLKDEEVKTYYEDLGRLAGWLKEMRRIDEELESYLVAVAENSDGQEELEILCDEENDWVRDFGNALKDYKDKVANFATKYAEGAEDYDQMMEEYGEISSQGEELEERYAVVSWSEILGISEDEFRGAFDKAEQLMRILEKK